jgi:hypothetical protein
MVFIKIKNNEHDVFMVESKTDLQVDQVIQDIVRIHNLRVKLNVLISEAEELSKYGVAKPPEKQGLDEELNEKLKIEEVYNEEEEEEYNSGKGKGKEVSEAPTLITTKDPTFRRWGNRKYLNH